VTPPADTARPPSHADAGRARALWQALRPHQWVKNLLLFVPLLLAHRLDEPGLWLAAVIGFVAFSLCASSAYVINDLADRESDRAHPIKRDRPFAAGALSPSVALVLAPGLLVAALALAWWALPPLFMMALAVYAAATLAYSLALKRVVLVDVMVLAGLYAMRILAGSAATGVPVSAWLLAFALFFFLSLALLKRYAELRLLQLEARVALRGRGYRGEDLELLRAAGPAAGFLSVLVLALYVATPDVLVLYERPGLLWLVGALLLYWNLRAWLIAQRAEMHDDPVLFAARDRVSYVVGGLTVLILVAATL
jgi:4-hydroxybenzoate polyprenyltransferase